MPTKRQKLAQSLTGLRDAAGVSQGFIARSLGCSRPLISQREKTGRVPVEALEQTLALCGASDTQRLSIWTLHFEAEGHPSEHAERMARAKVLDDEVAA